MSARLFIFMITLVLSACDNGNLRGSVEQSKDGKTYLRISEGNGCAQFKIDGKVWAHSVGEVGPIDSGPHTINCNGEIKFTIPKGVIFSFDYWGP